MRFFDHFGHLAHGHAAGAWIAIGIGLFVAFAGALAAISNRKSPEP